MPHTKNPSTDRDTAHERGGSHEQHVKAGRQSHGGTTQKSASNDAERGGSHEQHVKAGEQSHKNR
jgi:hypothetical protein